MISPSPTLVFVVDLASAREGSILSIAGVVHQHKRVPGGFAIKLKDATGLTWVHAHTLDRTVQKGTRLLVTGLARRNLRTGRMVLDCIDGPQVVGDLESLASADDAFREQASRLLVSRVIEYASSAFSAASFIQVDTRLLSTTSPAIGLEPMQALYPGFGAPVALSTSPASQLRDFIMVTGVGRAFTVSSSFSTSFRFPGAGNEMKVVMGLALNMDRQAHELLARRVVARVLARVGFWSPITEDSPEMPEGMRTVEQDSSKAVRSELWGASLDRWLSIEGPNGDVILEGSLERLGERVRIGSITLYPNQVLALLQTAPTRRLTDLRRIHGWRHE